VKNLGIEGVVIFLYYDGLETASNFYREIMNFKLVLNREWVKIYQLKDGAYIGLVKKGQSASPSLQRTSNATSKAVMISMMVSDVQSWYRYLQDQKVKLEGEPSLGKDVGRTAFRLWDPEGYVIEIMDDIHIWNKEKTKSKI